MLIRIKQFIAWVLGLPLRLFALMLRTEKMCRECAVADMSKIPSTVHWCLVPGAKLSSQHALTPMLIKRMDTAASLWKARPDIRLILSGSGADTEDNDALAMARYLQETHGIPGDCLLLDEKGFTTLDSVRNLPEEVKRAPFLLLTGAFHMPRCVYICRKLGLKPLALMMPQTRHKYDYLYRLREQAALVKAWYVLTFQMHLH